MSKHRMAKDRPLLPWTSARPDNREFRFLQIGNSLLMSKQFQQMNLNARYVYLCMCLEAGGHREFQFPKHIAEKYGIPPMSLTRARQELIEKGFIETKVCNRNLCKPNVYQFTFEWKQATIEPP